MKNMVELVTPRNRHRYQRELNQMFEMRYRAAMSMNWRLPEAVGEVDIDRFDRPDTVYVMDFDKDRNVIGCGRIIPTLGPTLLSEVFPEFCEVGVPSSPDIYEYSRCMIDSDRLDVRAFVRTRARINVAMNEYCLKVGIPKVAMLTYKRHYPLIIRNWKTRPLGLPRFCEDDQATYVAVLSDMTTDGLRSLMKSQYVKEPVLECGDGLDPAVRHTLEFESVR